MCTGGKLSPVSLLIVSMKKIIILLFVLIVAGSQGFGQAYVWPMPDGRQVSSTFGEHRFRHFHSGIDIKTNHSTGYPVIAVEDGYVWRLRVSPVGFGKAVYLKLRDGNFAVYGHLDEFSSRLLNYVEIEQQWLKRYAIDIYPGENVISVRKGDTLAFSGNTASVSPHLHFEVRDAQERPMNPFNFIPEIVDYTIPTIRELAIVPLDVRSRIDDSPRLKTFPVYFREKRNFTVKDTIRVTGEIGIALKTFDTIKGLPNKYAPYGIRMLVNDSLQFAVQYDLFAFDETRLVDLDRDSYFLENGNGNFNRLWIHPSAKSLPIYRLSPGTGVLNFPPGCHSVRIEVYDHRGNTSTLDVVFESAPERKMAYPELKHTNGGFQLTFEKPSWIAHNRWSAQWATKYGNPVQPAKIIKTDTSGALVILTVSEGSTREKNLRINIGDEFPPVFVNVGEDAEESPKISFEYIEYPESFICHLTFRQAPRQHPAFFLQSIREFRQLDLYPETPIDFITAPTSFVQWKDAIACEIRISSEPMTVYRKPVRLKCVEPKTGGSVTSPDSLFQASFVPGSVYDTLLSWIDTVSAHPGKNGNQVSKIYRIYPETEPLQDSIWVEFNYPAFVEKVEQYGVYLWRDGKWSYLGNEIDPARDVIRADLRKLGDFCLMKDQKPPVIKNVFPGNGGRFRSSSIDWLKASVSDALSGIRDDLSIQVRLDEVPVIVEYCGIKKTLRYRLRHPLKPGRHQVKINAIDRAGNVSTAVSEFTIISGQ